MTAYTGKTTRLVPPGVAALENAKDAYLQLRVSQLVERIAAMERTIKSESNPGKRSALINDVRLTEKRLEEIFETIRR